MKNIALVQMTSTVDMEANLKSSLSFIEQAADADADLVAFPENFLLLGNRHLYKKSAESIPGPQVRIFQREAQEKDISILMGSIYETNPHNPAKIFNTSVLINRNGEIAARYRKIHLFDITLPAVTLHESELTSAGNQTVVCDHEIGKIGLTICYDIRFPNLYQKLTTDGACIVFVPSAFTVPTGRDHWITLLQARAIENQLYIAAPAQFGRHSNSRESYGHSVFIDPWGSILAQSPDREGIIVGEMDLDHLREIRQRMPVQVHRVEGID